MRILKALNLLTYFALLFPCFQLKIDAQTLALLSSTASGNFEAFRALGVSSKTQRGLVCSGYRCGDMTCDKGRLLSLVRFDFEGSSCKLS